MSTTPSNPVQSCQPNTETPRQTPTPDDYVIRKGGFYYRPNAEGYCSDILEAGRWSRAEALSHQKGVEGVTIHLFRDRYPPLREKARDAEIATLTARIEELETALRFIADGYDNHDVNHLDYRVKVRKQAYETARHIIGHLEGNCGLSFADVKQNDWDTLTNLIAAQPREAFADEIKRADAAPPEASFDNASDMLGYLNAPREAEPVTERMAFIRAYPHLDLTEVPDAWGRPMFKHSHVQALWDGWFARAVLASPSPIPEAPGREEIIEECLQAARKGFEESMANYVLIGPSGMAMAMINAIRALGGESGR